MSITVGLMTAEDQAVKLLPCMCAFISEDMGLRRGRTKPGHWALCQASMRPAVAAALAVAQAEIERLRVDVGEAMLVVESAEHKLGIAFAALKPFADVARRLGPEHADENEAPIAWSRTGPNISIGDLRRAALASPSEPAGGRKGDGE